MAARKKSAASSEVAVSPHAAQLPAELADRFGQFAQDVEATAHDLAGSGWPFISIRGGQFSLKQQALENPQRVVIVGVTLDNAYYKREFNPDDQSPPDCAAVGRTADVIAPPHDWPAKQSENCRTCWANAWGSNPKGGRGKACGNRVRLCVLPFYKGVDLAKVEGARLRVPTTSMPNFDKLVNEVKALNSGKAPVFAYVTEVELEPDPKNTLKMTFKLLAALPRDVMPMVFNRITEAEVPLLQVNDPNREEKAPEGAKGARKKAGRARR